MHVSASTTKINTGLLIFTSCFFRRSFGLSRAHRERRTEVGAALSCSQKDGW
jgi:hypothetical protein